jgi:translation initiation factor IF-3
MTSREAYLLAQEKGLDLVKINPGSNPPVAKIMDYGKYKFDKAKQEKQAKKTQHVSELKEIRLSMTIDVGDVQTKAKHAHKFLTAGDKVKVSIRMKGRQQAHAKLGIDVMKDFFALVEPVGVMEKNPLTEGRNIIMILAPKKEAGQ